VPTYHHGRHEHGQNFLTDPQTIHRIIDLVRDTEGPILEIGPGAGALTRPLLRLGRPTQAVEIDAHLVRKLNHELQGKATITEGDFLKHRVPEHPHVIVGNLPFHQTTAILRHLLHAPGWTDAVLLVQWEVARRRAGVGGASMMTAQWSPWFDFTLHGRVPARAFTPTPGVDGGLIAIRRDANPAIPARERRRFQSLVHQIYTGPGRGLAQILARNTDLGTPTSATAWLRERGLTGSDLPKSLSAEAWIDLYRTTGTSPPPQRDRRSGKNRRHGRR